MTLQQRVQVIWKALPLKRWLISAGSLGISQLIGAAGNVFLIRNIGVANYGIAAGATSIVAITLPIALLQFHVILPLARDDMDQVRLLLVSLLGSFCAALFTCVAVGAASVMITIPIAASEESLRILSLIPCTLVATCFGILVNAVLVARGQTVQLAIVRVLRASSLLLVVQLDTGEKLLFKYLATDVVCTSSAMSWILMREYRQLRDVRFSFRGLLGFAKEHSTTPRFAILSDTFNSVAASMPVFALSTHAALQQAALYGFLQRLVGGPVSLLTTAAGDAFRFTYSEHVKVGRSGRPTILAFVIPLASIGVLGVAAIALEWRDICHALKAPELISMRALAVVIGVYFAFKLTTNPVSWTFLARGRAKLESGIQFLSAGVVGVLSLLFFHDGDAQTYVVCVCGWLCLMYASYIYGALAMSKDVATA